MPAQTFRNQKPHRELFVQCMEDLSGYHLLYATGYMYQIDPIYLYLNIFLKFMTFGISFANCFYRHISEIRSPKRTHQVIRYSEL